MNECYRILKPGGIITITTPNIESLGHKIFKNNWRGLEPPRHLFLFNGKALHALAEKSGFQRIRTFTTISGSYGIFKLSWAIKRSKGKRIKESQPFYVSACSWFLELVEWLIGKKILNMGEQIVLEANKI